MGLDLSKIKGISDDVKAKLANVKNKEEMDAVLKAENLTIEQLREMNGGIRESDPECKLEPCYDLCDGLGCGRLFQ